MADADTQLLHMLKKCFTDAEWEVLMKQTAFIQAANNLHNAGDVEKALAMGLKLVQSARPVR